MSGFLYQIEKRQKEAVEQHDLTQGPQLLSELRVAHRRAKERYMEDKVKIIGVPAPTSIHTRMEAFIAEHKDDATMPQNKKTLALACIVKFLDDDAKRNPPQLLTIDDNNDDDDDNDADDDNEEEEEVEEEKDG